MTQILSLFNKEIFRVKSLLLIAGITIFYTLFPIYAMNYHYILSQLISTAPTPEKFTSFLSILQSVGRQTYVCTHAAATIFTNFTPPDISLLITTGIVVGINVVLLIKTIKRMKQTGSPLKFVVGGSGVVGLFSYSCASCGLSLASIFGLSTSFGFLPYGNKSLYILAIGISLYSMYYMLKKLQTGTTCAISRK